MFDPSMKYYLFLTILCDFYTFKHINYFIIRLEDNSIISPCLFFYNKHKKKHYYL
jgi:hypothetical protein